MSELDSFRSLLGQLAEDVELRAIGEEATKQAFVLPILEQLGWNTKNVREVIPEFAFESGRVDYCLALDREPRVLIEVKAVDQRLDDHQEQLLNYAFRGGVELAVLTNGTSWWLYLPLIGGSWEDRKFFAIDIGEQPAESAAEHFVRFLSRAAVLSKKAVQEARKTHESSQQQAAVARALPIAWSKLVSEPDSVLVDLLGDLLAETVEKVCGHKPDVTTAATFITERLALAEKPELDREGLSGNQRSKIQRRPPTDLGRQTPRPVYGRATPYRAFRIPILEALESLGGRDSQAEVLNRVERAMERTLNSTDRQTNTGGQVKWRNRAAWERLRMVREGLLEKNSPHGLWEISQRGREYLNKARAH